MMAEEIRNSLRTIKRKSTSAIKKEFGIQDKTSMTEEERRMAKQKYREKQKHLEKPVTSTEEPMTGIQPNIVFKAKAT